MRIETRCDALGHHVIIDRIRDGSVAPAAAIAVAACMPVLRSPTRSRSPAARSTHVSNNSPQKMAEAWWIARPVSVKRALGPVSANARRGQMQCVTALIGAYAVLQSRGARTAAVSAAAPPATLPDIVPRRKMPSSVSIGMTPVINGAFRPAGNAPSSRTPFAGCGFMLRAIDAPKKCVPVDAMACALRESARASDSRRHTTKAEMAQHPALAQNLVIRTSRAGMRSPERSRAPNIRSARNGSSHSRRKMARTAK